MCHWGLLCKRSVHPEMKMQSLSTQPHVYRRRVKFCSPQNISGASQVLKNSTKQLSWRHFLKHEKATEKT